ncbi:MAG: transposase [Pseudomonadales bacterium]|jgi:transposase|nr:transposase [Pseudomonadales bacterium]MCP5319660.1 transposase [Pseudomonadales bacterium]MCP5337408.1 transposase [Pseudomonadales bacterium]
MGKRSELSVEKRIEAVLSMLRKEEPAAQVARRYGVSEQSLYRWRDDFLQAGKQGLSGKTANAALTKEVSRLQREIESREQVIGELTVANRVLKNLSRGLPRPL